MKKKPKVWLAKDAIGVAFNKYVLSFFAPPKREGRCWIGDVEINPFYFEKLAPKSCHLKPGEGPIEIDIKITRRK